MVTPPPPTPGSQYQTFNKFLISGVFGGLPGPPAFGGVQLLACLADHRWMVWDILGVFFAESTPVTHFRLPTPSFPNVGFPSKGTTPTPTPIPSPNRTHKAHPRVTHARTHACMHGGMHSKHIVSSQLIFVACGGVIVMSELLKLKSK